MQCYNDQILNEKKIRQFVKTVFFNNFEKKPQEAMVKISMEMTKEFFFSFKMIKLYT